MTRKNDVKPIGTEIIGVNTRFLIVEGKIKAYNAVVVHDGKEVNNERTKTKLLLRTKLLMQESLSRAVVSMTEVKKLTEEIQRIAYDMNEDMPPLSIRQSTRKLFKVAEKLNDMCGLETEH